MESFFPLICVANEALQSSNLFLPYDVIVYRDARDQTKRDYAIHICICTSMGKISHGK